MVEIQTLDASLQICRRTQTLHEILEPTPFLRVVIPLSLDIDVMSLNVKDKLVLRPSLTDFFLVRDLLGTHFVAWSENLVQRNHGRGHATAGIQELATAHPQLIGRGFGNRP